jgi:hypothetical protein
MATRLVGIALLLLVACGSLQKPPGKVVTSDSQIEILDPIGFTSETELTPSSYRTLDAIASTFVGNPSIQRVEVQVYVLDGDEATRRQRADQRARLLVDYLVTKQVATERLEPRGYITPPAEDPTNHVRFFILKRDQAD